MELTDLFCSIGNAIREKNGTVDKIAPVDFASKISGIQTQTISIKTGTFTVATDTSICWSQYSSKFYSIEHGLSDIPNLFWIGIETDPMNAVKSSGSFIAALYFTKSIYFANQYERSYNNIGGISTDTPGGTVDSKFIKIGVPTTTYLRAGVTYRWLAAII